MPRILYTFLILPFFLFTNSKQPEYLKYVNEIVSGFVKDTEKKHKLHCYASGGSMPNDVEKIEVFFDTHQHATVEDARKIEVDIIQSLLKRINSHEKIRPYLKEYPFKTDRIGLLISFLSKTNEHPIDGSVASVFLAKNKIFYRAAEIHIQKPTPLTYMNDKNEIVREFIEGGPRERLIPIMNESYEEALKIVEGIDPETEAHSGGLDQPPPRAL
jgi:hypothetical protein